MPVFNPVNPRKQFKEACEKIQTPDCFLKVHMNRLDMDGGIIGKLESKTFGFEEILKDLKFEILDFFETVSPFAPYLLTVKGEIGSGKTIFVLNLIEELVKSSLFTYYQTWSN